MTHRVIQIVSGDLWAGAEAMVFSLVQELCKKHNACELGVILLNYGELERQIRMLGVPVWVVDETQKSFFHIFCRIRSIILQFKPHILHSHRYKEHFLAFLASRSVNNDICLIATQHGMPENYDSHINIRRRVLTDASFLILSLFFDKTVLVSKDIANLVKKRFFFGYNNTAVIHNGIRPATCCQKLCVNPFVIGSAGRLVPVKNYRLMLRIVELISCHRDKNIVFKLAGDGPEKGMLCELAEIHGLGKKIEFLGHLDNMEAFYKTIDLYLNTSLHEGIPMTILEAMSHGIPVIAPDVGGIREIIDDGRDGFVMEQRTAHDFAMKCLFFHKNEDEYHKMSRLAVRKIIKKFTAKKMASDYCRLYDDLHV